jgi:hypothetical protein
MGSYMGLLSCNPGSFLRWWFLGKGLVFIVVVVIVDNLGWFSLAAGWGYTVTVWPKLTK